MVWETVFMVMFGMALYNCLTNVIRLLVTGTTARPVCSIR